MERHVDRLERRGCKVRQINRHMRRSYDANFKMKVIRAAETSNNCQAAKKFGVTECNVRRWRVQKELLKNTHCKRKSYRGPQSGRFREIDQRVSEFVTEKRSEGKTISRASIQLKALDIAEELNIPTSQFKASIGWCRRMMSRSGIVLRRRNSHNQRHLPLERGSDSELSEEEDEYLQQPNETLTSHYERCMNGAHQEMEPEDSPKTDSVTGSQTDTTVFPADVHQLSVMKKEQQEWRETKPLLIKEEEQLNDTTESQITLFSVKKEDKKPPSSPLYQRQTDQIETGADEEEYEGSMLDIKLKIEEPSEPETDDSDDWSKTEEDYSGLNSKNLTNFRQNGIPSLSPSGESYLIKHIKSNSEEKKSLSALNVERSLNRNPVKPHTGGFTRGRNLSAALSVGKDSAESFV